MNIEKKLIMLKENGVNKVHAVNEIAVKTIYKTDIYIPNDRYNVGSVTVDRNGTFIASSYGLDGFSRVRVEIQLPYEGKTRSGVDYRVYEDVTGKPHIEVLKEEILGGT